MKNPIYSIKKEYHGSFKQALVKITQALQNEGFGILTQIDVSATLKKKLNVEYPKYVILGACNPHYAYKALLAEKEIGLLLPCNVALYDEGGKLYIAIMKPSAVLTLTSNLTIVKVARDIEAKLIKALNEATNIPGDKL